MLSVMGGSTPDRGATAPAPAGPSAARDLNTTRVVSLLRDGGPLTQAELIRRSGLARPTVTAIIRDLLLRHVVVAAGRDTSAVNGRPGALLAFDPRSETVAVVRVLPGLTEIWVADSEADFLGHRRRAGHVDTVAGLGQLSAEIAQLALDLGLSQPRSIGMLLVGRNDPSTGLCAGPALGAEPVPLTRLEERLGAAVTVLNPTAAAALGVARSGRHSDAVVIFLDRGIGAGIVCGGQVLEGAAGGAGELGHCRVPGVTATCQCGRSGCLETVAAGWYLQERASEILGPRTMVPSTLAGLENLGHPAIDRLLEAAARQLGLAASWLVNTLDPRAVLLGGTPFAAGAERFLTSFADSVRRNAVADRGSALIVDFAASTADIDGAAQAALDRVTLR
jgi:predicted NBD/HSP70 family sugar kinase